MDINEFNLQELKDYCLRTLELLGTITQETDFEEEKRLLNSWSERSLLTLPFTCRGNHFSLLPNYMALRASGYEVDDSDPFSTNNGHSGYIEAILETANAVLDIRDQVGDREMFRYYPPFPDLFLFCPSVYKDLMSGLPLINEHAEFNRKKAQRVFVMMQRQKGYNYEMNQGDIELLITKDGPAKEFLDLASYRSSEIRLNSAVLGLKAASTMSAVLRLPNAINKSAGEIRQFSNQVRSSNSKPWKRVRAFEKAQEVLRLAFPSEFIDTLKRSKTGIKILSDVPLEWLPVDGLPLGIKNDVSRIPVTPGNLQVIQLAPFETINLDTSAFSEILICSALQPNDPIRSLFETTFDVLAPSWREKIILKVVETRNRAEFVNALNSFKGAMMIFDGHGSHEPGDNSGRLWLHNEAVDVWELRNEIDNVPPIVFLSACDTHAADRSHATTAAGFLNMGVRTVFSSTLPINARDAAVFVGRLLFRIAAFIPAVTGSPEYGRAIRWTEVVGGMIRMQLMTDFLRILIDEEVLDESLYMDIAEQGNAYINCGHPAPFEAIRIFMNQNYGISEEILNDKFRMAIATSTTIAYIQIGNPETILIDTQQDRIQRFQELETLISDEED
jgi:hypothetical protein